MKFLMLRAPFALALLALTSCTAGRPQTAAPPAPAPGIPWVLFTMDQVPGGGYAEYLWKPVEPFPSAEACRATLRVRSDRGPIAPVGLIVWYQAKGQPAGHWVGCLPSGYDPHERR